MAKSAQRKAVESYRSRLTERGVVRFELQALEADRGLLRTLARKLIANGKEAGRIRLAMQEALAREPSKTGGVLAALRRSPLVGAGLDFARQREDGRKVDL